MTTVTDITQERVFSTIGHLLGSVVSDINDVSKIEFTASQVTITGVDYQGKRAEMTVPYQNAN